MRFISVSPRGSTPLSSTRTEKCLTATVRHFFVYLQGFQPFRKSELHRN
nr:MAG TPA: hypothetical protein [Caudoviricetes sp.]